MHKWSQICHMGYVCFLLGSGPLLWRWNLNTWFKSALDVNMCLFGSGGN
uniref:Uncharacterized protein n=1 Tax=Rhizophora mucronata TaxID=61149 RepID=A0A2P2N375_RHIMU